MRRAGEVSIREAATFLELHPRTVRRWVKERISGGQSRLQRARKDLAGRYWLQIRELIRLRFAPPDDFV